MVQAWADGLCPLTRPGLKPIVRKADLDSVAVEAAAEATEAAADGMIIKVTRVSHGSRAGKSSCRLRRARRCSKIIMIMVWESCECQEADPRLTSVRRNKHDNRSSGIN